MHWYVVMYVYLHSERGSNEGLGALLRVKSLNSNVMSPLIDHNVSSAGP